MTGDNIRANVADEMKLADSALKAAQALLDLGLPADAASRTYYAALHAARALLFSAGIEAHSHRGVRSLVARHFVRAGGLTAERSKQFAQLEALRSAGDYDTAFALGVDEVHPELAKARGFVEDVRALLRAGGWVA